MADGITEAPPRRWPVGTPEPQEVGLRVQSVTNHIIFRLTAPAHWGRWLAEQASGGDGNEYSWHAINSEHADEGGMEVVEVLDAPATPKLAADGITDEIPANAVAERWVTETPDEVTNHSGDGHRYARWGQCVISYDEEREPIPAVYSSGWEGGEVEFGADNTWRLTLDEAEAFIARLQHAIAYERARALDGGDDA